MIDIRHINSKHDIKSIEIFLFFPFWSVIYDNKVFEYLYPINQSNMNLYINAYVSPMSWSKYRTLAPS